MGQDWKTLTVVVLGAAVAGWLVVRMLSSAPADRDATATGTAPVARAVASPVAAAMGEPEPTVEPAGPGPKAGPVSTADEGGGNVALIARDLEVLSQALVRDQRIEDRLMPRINDALDVPGVTSYRRAPDFWEPAFASSGGANR